MRKKIGKVFVCAIVVAGLGWLAASRTHFGGHSSASNVTEIKIDNYSFSPVDITVPVGTTVRWINHDDVPHTVKSNDGIFKSKALDTDDKFSIVFDKPGVYEYFCSIHPRMTARIVVR